MWAVALRPLQGAIARVLWLLRVSSAVVVFACVPVYAILPFLRCHRDASVELEQLDDFSGTSVNTPQ